MGVGVCVWGGGGITKKFSEQNRILCVNKIYDVLFFFNQFSYNYSLKVQIQVDLEIIKKNLYQILHVNLFYN